MLKSVGNESTRKKAEIIKKNGSMIIYIHFFFVEKRSQPEQRQ